MEKHLKKSQTLSSIGSIALSNAKVPLPFRFLTKPWVKDDLIETIESCRLENEEKQKENLVATKLVETNQQLEFMLRQKLIS
ncbi:MAG: hypothetical protein ACI80H_000675 [Pseudoalteromonas distincta]